MNGLSFSDATDIKLGATSITALYYGSTLIWPSGPAPTNWANEYLQIEALEPMTITTSMPATKTVYDTLDVQYSTDKTTWNSWNANVSLSLQTNDIVYFKGSYIYNASGYSGNSRYLISTTDKMYNVRGNIMSLIFGDNFIGQTSLSGYMYCFTPLFANSKVIDASNLILPATTLDADCYKGMFGGCSSLTSAPELPATTLASGCYNLMFRNCTSLTSAPELPATILTTGCYENMFDGCTSLTSAPELQATSLAGNCYNEMFKNCTSLTSAPNLHATTLANDCYEAMFYGCSSLTTAPELPASTLAASCYQQMFYGCSLLNYVKCLATDMTAGYCIYMWLDNVAATGTFVKDANTTWTSGPNGIPSGWTVYDAS